MFQVFHILNDGYFCPFPHFIRGLILQLQPSSVTENCFTSVSSVGVKVTYHLPESSEDFIEVNS